MHPSYYRGCWHEVSRCLFHRYRQPGTSRGFFPIKKQFTTRSAFFLHAAWLRQSCLHCAIFLTAASRRSLVRVSVPVRGITLSGPLTIVVLVSRYLTNKLIVRMVILYRRSFQDKMMPSRLVWGINPDFSGLFPSKGRFHTCYAPVRRSSAEASFPVTPRLACVKPAASVHPEPGSNSPL